MSVVVVMVKEWVCKEVGYSSVCCAVYTYREETKGTAKQRPTHYVAVKESGTRRRGSRSVFFVA